MTTSIQHTVVLQRWHPVEPATERHVLSAARVLTAAPGVQQHLALADLAGAAATGAGR